MSWWEDQGYDTRAAARADGYGPPASDTPQTYDPQSFNGQPTSGAYGGGQGGSINESGLPDPNRDPEGYVNELMRRAGYQYPSPEALQAIEPYLERAGLHLQRNSAGQIRGRVYIGNGYDNHFDVMGAAGFVPGQVGGALGGMLGGLGGMFGSGDVANDPSFQFRLQEAQKGLERSAAAKGTLMTGGFAKALTKFNQDYASGEYQNIFNRLFNVSQLGLQAAGGAANVGSNYSGNLGQNNRNFADQYGSITGERANAQAAGQVNSSNAWNGAIGNLANMGAQWATRRGMSKRYPMDEGDGYNYSVPYPNSPLDPSRV